MEDNVRVIDRAFDILEALAVNGSSMGLSEICRATGISKSTVYRLISTMHNRHYVEKNPDNTYSIGYKLIETVSLHINHLDLLTEARPCLNDIMHNLGLTAHLGILDGCDVIYLEKTDLYATNKQYTEIGYRSPAYCSSIGKCLLACLSREELEEVMQDCTFERYTPNTITDFSEFKRYLKVVRHQGWAMDNQEYQLGHRCIGAPVYDYRGTAIAAISASGSALQIPDERIESVEKYVIKTAETLSRRLGYV